MNWFNRNLCEYENTIRNLCYGDFLRFFTEKIRIMTKFAFGNVNLFVNWAVMTVIFWRYQ